MTLTDELKPTHKDWICQNNKRADYKPTWLSLKTDNSMAGYSLRFPSCRSTYHLSDYPNRYDTSGEDKQDDLGEGDQDGKQDNSEER